MHVHNLPYTMQAGRQTDRHTFIHTDRDSETYIHNHANRQKDRQADMPVCMAPAGDKRRYIDTWIHR